MRVLLACGALFVATPAFADDVPAPAPASPAPGPAPAAPAPEAAEPSPAPKADPAYSEKPDPAYGGERPGADGGPGYFAAPAGKDIYIKSYPDRSHTNVLGLSIAAGTSVVLGGIGLYFHLDSRDLSNQVSANKTTGEVWTTERQDIYDSANRSALAAGVFYGLGGAILIGTAVAYMVTEPKMETTVIHPHVDRKPTALIAPTRGGALVGGTWSF